MSPESFDIESRGGETVIDKPVKNPKAVVTKNFTDCIADYTECVNVLEKTSQSDLETCRVTFHQCSLLILNQTNPEQTVTASAAGQSLVPQKIKERVSDQLLNCIEDYFVCVTSKFGMCDRSYHRCTMSVLDSQIQGDAAETYEISNVVDVASGKKNHTFSPKLIIYRQFRQFKK